MDAFDRLSIWDDPALARALGWYRAVAAGRAPPKFRIAATVPAGVDLAAPEPALWDALDPATAVFLDRREAARGGARLPLPAEPSLLDLVAELARRMLADCTFCAWECRVNRAAGRAGACRLGPETRVGAAFRHRGEELVYRGREGSGTVFFTSCNMRCAFCQNGDIARDKDNGRAVSDGVLAALAATLWRDGCHNVNWVGGDPAIHLHRILGAIARLGRGEPDADETAAALRLRSDRPGPARREGPCAAPMLWNSNMFLTDRAMALLRPVIDVWLPDFKFGPPVEGGPRCEVDLARTPGTWAAVTRQLATLGAWGEDLTVRHLVMPGHLDCCTRPVLDWLAGHLPDAPVNVMDQYNPDGFADPASPAYRPRHAALARLPARAEIRGAWAHAETRGLAWETLTIERADRGLFG